MYLTATEYQREIFDLALFLADSAEVSLDEIRNFSNVPDREKIQYVIFARAKWRVTVEFKPEDHPIPWPVFHRKCAAAIRDLKTIIENRASKKTRKKPWGWCR